MNAPAGADEVRADLRKRIESALGASIDRCARCKVCEHQVDAVMGLLLRITREYAVAWGGDVEVPGAVRLEVYDDQADAAEHTSLYPKPAYVVQRVMASTTWERAPEAGSD